MSFSPAPAPRPGNSGRPEFNRFLLGVAIGAIAGLIGFLIGVAYFLWN